MVRLLAACLLLLLVPVASAAGALDAEVRRISEKGGAGRALWGVYAVDLKTGKELAALNDDKLFIPASNRKVVTAALVARAFKGDERIQTAATAAEVSGAAASGVVVHASGDPSWTPALTGGRPGRHMLDRLSRSIAEGGVRRIDGEVLIDTSVYEEASPIPPAWRWDDFASSYASRPSAISLDRNLAGLRIEPARAGEPARADAGGGEAPFQIVNTSTTGRAGSAPTLQVVASPSGDSVHLSGSLPADAEPATRSIPMGDPMAVVRGELRAALQRAGIEFSGPVRVADARQPRGKVIGAIEGSPMADIVRECLQDSDNFLAESLYLLASARMFQRASYRASHEAEARYWKRVGVPEDHFLASDGSGLSRENLVTPRALVALLRDMRETDWFVDALPVSGRSGTLRYRLSENGLAGRVRAKTGTLDTAGALTGYIRTASGREIAFAVLANHHTCSSNTIRARIDEIVELLARQ
ncbi:MAG: D-alanyl-D-alanine carboxypeptidase/D-alanyl-D-alanine-endopeptidase [Candidatus Sumerlaeia bacterium]|nr:D-alanyl-D-alanine carboxypeptidase/D-alanyl-D-alanine-endopeptidase [Candidatus Sumerlaeia bacterium]